MTAWRSQLLIPGHQQRKEFVDGNNGSGDSASVRLDLVEGAICENIINQRIQGLVVSIARRRRIQQRHLARCTGLRASDS